ncbi:TPA: hypothetical protein ACKQHR_001553 [Pseudomonas aeruginosa]
MAAKEHLKGHSSFADMVSTHIGAWREALVDSLMIKGDTDDRSAIEHEIQSLDDIAAALEVELAASAGDVAAEGLSEENQELRSMLAEKVVSETRLRSFALRHGGSSISLEGGACALLIQSLAKQLYDSDAVNYIELSFDSPDYPTLGLITVTLKRESGKTPHERIIMLEEQRKGLQTDNEQLMAALAPFARFALARLQHGGGVGQAGAVVSSPSAAGTVAITDQHLQRALQLVRPEVAAAGAI